MTRARWILTAASLLLALGTVGMIGAGWKDRANEICGKEAPRSGGDFTLSWQWDQIAYVCDYRAPDEPPRSVSVLDAFHSDGSRHGR